MALGLTGISVTLIKNTLGAGVNSVSGLCLHANVNMFSKRKPVDFPADVTDGNNTWWKDRHGRCGIDIPVLPAVEQAESYNWRRLPPSGGAVSPFRLGDFRGYEHNAYPVIQSMYSKEVEVNKATNNGKLSMMFVIAASTETNLGIADIDNPPLRNLYVGAALVDSSGVKRADVTGTDTLGNNGGVLEIDVSRMSEGKYTMYLYLSDKKQTQGGALVGRTLYALYHDSSHLVKVPVRITMYSPIQFTITGIGYNLRGPYEAPDNFSYFTRALQTYGEVVLRCTLTAKSGSPGGSYAVADMSAKIDRTFFDVPYTGGLIGCVYDADYRAVNSVEVSAGQSKAFYIYGSFLNRTSSGISGGGASGKTIMTGISILGRGAYMGGLPFVAVCGSGSFVDYSGGGGMNNV